jgi:hypothetical protein
VRSALNSERRSEATRIRECPTPKGVQELSPGWRLGGTVGIGSKKARGSEGAKESFERRAIKAARYSRMTINYTGSHSCFFCEDSPSIGQVDVRESPVTSHLGCGYAALWPSVRKFFVPFCFLSHERAESQICWRTR